KSDENETCRSEDVIGNSHSHENDNGGNGNLDHDRIDDADVGVKIPLTSSTSEAKNANGDSDGARERIKDSAKHPDSTRNIDIIETNSEIYSTIPIPSTENNNLHNPQNSQNRNPSDWRFQHPIISQCASKPTSSPTSLSHPANEISTIPRSISASVASAATAVTAATSSPPKPIRMHEREKGLSFGVDNDYSESLLDEEDQQQIMNHVVRETHPREIIHTSSSHDDYSHMSALESGHSASGTFDRERDDDVRPKKSPLVADDGGGGGSYYYEGCSSANDNNGNFLEDNGVNSANGKRSNHNRRFKYSNGWGSGRKRRTKNGRYILPGTEEEERVMGECSFFYNEPDVSIQDDERMMQMVQPHHVVDGYEKHGHGCGDDDSDYGNSDEFEDGEGPDRYNHRNRRIDPRAMANAISSTAKRQWKERRYRRRLRQSSHGVMGTSSPWGDSGNRPNHPFHHHPRPHHPNDIHTNPSRDSSELTPEHRQIFLAAHAALNGKQSNEYRARGRDMKEEYGYDVDFPDMDLNLEPEEDDDEEIRADLTHSSLAIRGGQIRLPTDNVRLVMDPLLEPGILSVETKALVGSRGNLPSLGGGNRYGYCDGGSVNGAGPDISSNDHIAKDAVGNERNGNRPRANTVDSSAEHPWRRSELSYVLTVDEQLYQRVVREMGDSYRLPCGVYYCCHEVEGEGGHDHVGIGVAVVLLMVIFTFLVVCMFIWPMD
ncbi:hypothetical protein ACHAXS_004596, partial [Conticribra weissflogii]